LILLAGSPSRGARERFAAWRRPRGPEAVLASLERGLAGEGIGFVVNPRRLGSSNVVGVLSDLDRLATAIEWRRGGSDRRLLAGPNLVVLPSDEPSLMTAPEIDLCLVPSEWVKALYEEDSPDLRGRVAVWPAGVDPAYWAPAEAQRRAVVYVKRLDGQENVSDAELAGVASALEGAGFDVVRLDYGSFKPRAYRDALRGAELMVFFSPTESQCLGLVEAWAADVPTLVWDCGRLEYKGRVYRGSSAPYLSPATGATFGDFDELIVRWDELRSGFRPREWVLENMTDAVSARAYRDLAAGAY
jgi:glycosyltransferase involved in cell wall biosynthesis